MNQAELRARRSRAQMAAIVSEHEKSGISAYAFCRERGLNASAFYRWRRTLQNARPRFVEVTLQSEANVPASSIPLLEVKLECGAEIQVFDPGLARGLLSQIVRPGAAQ